MEIECELGIQSILSRIVLQACFVHCLFFPSSLLPLGTPSPSSLSFLHVLPPCPSSCLSSFFSLSFLLILHLNPCGAVSAINCHAPDHCPDDQVDLFTTLYEEGSDASSGSVAAEPVLGCLGTVGEKGAEASDLSTILDVDEIEDNGGRDGVRPADHG